MKIVFCGPPHSGKSVFIENLLKKMPTDSMTIIRACPDGEGNWSNNENQNETSMVRKKGKFTNTFIQDACKAIDNQTNKIVLVDAGGVMSKENEEVFQHCDSFVVLSSDEKKKEEWLQFGNDLGLDCIASLDSSLEGQEEVYTELPYLQGRIVGLERGQTLENSPIINGVISTIIKKSKYFEQESVQETTPKEVFIDDTDLGFELGYGKEIYTNKDMAVRQVRWKEEAIPQLYQCISEKVKNTNTVRLNGIRANFILSAICKACRQNNVENISLYDVRSSEYIPIKNIPKQANLNECEGLDYHIVESQDNLFMDVDITKEKYSLEDYEKCVLPEIDGNKSLYLSGRLPNWLLASITSSYQSSRIFTFQPGRGFTCVSSAKKNELGTVATEIEGIDVKQYFEDKKNGEQNIGKELIVPQKKGIWGTIKTILEKIRNRKNSVKAKEYRELPNTLENIKVPPEQISHNISTKQNTRTKTLENRDAK